MEVLRLGQCRILQDPLSGLTFHLSDSGLSAYAHRMVSESFLKGTRSYNDIISSVILKDGSLFPR